MTAKEIKELRLRLGWTQERLGRELGVSFPTVNRWENNKNMPSPLALRELNKLKKG